MDQLYEGMHNSIEGPFLRLSPLITDTTDMPLYEEDRCE